MKRPELVVFGVLVSLGGFWIGVYEERLQVANCQQKCEALGLVCSPRLHDGLDYCVPVEAHHSQDVLQ